MRFCFIIYFISKHLISLSVAQNLVLNPSFELYKLCPSSKNLNFSSDIMQRFCHNWESIGIAQRLAIGAGGQYLNTCVVEPFPANGLPNSKWAYQHPHSGNAVAQILISGSSTFSESRLFYGVELAKPLVVGKKYKIGFYINLADSCKSACNNIGIRLFTDKVKIKDTTSKNDMSYDDFAHVYTKDIIEEKVDWVKVDGTIIADSAYSYLAIGNFFNKNSTTYKFDLPHGSSDIISYLIDDVFVEEAEKSINVQQTTYCINDTAILDAMGADENFFWSLNKTDTLSTNSSIKYLVTENTTLYLVSSNKIDSVVIAVIPQPEKVVPTQIELCDNYFVEIDAFNKNADKYLLNDVEINSTFKINKPGSYILKTITKTCHRYDTIDVANCNSSLYVPNAFSPNNDGLNDIFKPIGIQIYNYEMRVYNKWGQLIFFTNNIDNGWDGKDAPADVYFYTITYSDIDYKKNFYRKGNVTLIR